MNDNFEVPDNPAALLFDQYYQFLSRKYPLIRKSALPGMAAYDWYEVGDADAALEVVMAEGGNHGSHNPYWCMTWPSAYSISAFFNEQDVDLAGKTVLELGCGPGVAGIAAGFCDAQIVTFNDHVADALRFAGMNWTAVHGSEPALLQADWRTFPADGERYDLLLASDVAYEAAIFHPIIEVFDKALKPDGHVLLAEPNRGFAKDFFSMLQENGFTSQTLLNEPARNGQPMTITLYDIYRQG